MSKCKFNKAWIGSCDVETFDDTEYCKEHLLDKSNAENNINRCRVCGEQATHECIETFQFVCGTPICYKEICKIKHHPNHYKLTPQRWSEIYSLKFDKEIFGSDWELEIEFKQFETKMTIL